MCFLDGVLFGVLTVLAGLALNQAKEGVMSETMGALLHSRKFLVLVLDAAVSITLYFAGKYLGESTYNDIWFLIGVLQPVALMMINSIAQEDAAAWQSGSRSATTEGPTNG